MKVVIVIGVYNEAQNTPEMIEALAKVLPTIKKHEVHVLYVDGNSPDGTADIIRKYQKNYDWLHLIVEKEKNGLGAAYAIGMTHAMNKLQADYIGEMDGDLQHPPSVIPRLVDKIDNGYDFIIASRYIKGGSIPKDWGFDRKLLSIFGNLVARVLLILPNVHDVTGGFKLSRVKGFMDKFDFSGLLSKRFAYKVHLLFYMIQKGAKVKEVPFVFAPRNADESKINKNDMKETLRVIFLLQYHNPKIRQFFKFGVVGFLGYVVNASFLYLFTQLKFPSWAAWGGSTELAIISNFTFNNIWTFKDQKIFGLSRLAYKFFQFNLTSVGGLLIQVVIGVVTDYFFGTQYRQIVLPLSIVFLVLPYNYLMYTLVIWKKMVPSRQ